MSATDILIEPVDDATAPELIELVAADPLSQCAVSALPNDGLMVRLVVARRTEDDTIPVSARTPKLVLVVGDLRGGTRGERLLEMRSRSALSIAVVIVDSLKIGATAQLEHGFDCVVPVLAAGTKDPEAILTSAVSAVTAFATANRISVPVDEVYPFFERAGHATWGCGEDSNIVTATEMAMAGAGLSRALPLMRVLLHVEIAEGEYMAGLRRAAETLRRRMSVTDLVIAASVRGATAKRVSVVAIVGG